MEYAHVAIHCTDSKGAEGCFLWQGKNHKENPPVSPVMSSLVALYAWARLNGWRIPSWDERKHIPVHAAGTYVKAPL